MLINGLSPLAKQSPLSPRRSGMNFYETFTHHFERKKDEPNIGEPVRDQLGFNTFVQVNANEQADGEEKESAVSVRNVLNNSTRSDNDQPFEASSPFRPVAR